MWTFCVITTLLQVITCLNIEPDSDVRVLYKQLMKDYIPDVRPVKRHADQLQLHVNLKLSQIIRLDGKDEVLTFTAQIETVWYDVYLKWNRSEHNNIPGFVFPADKVWKPDINIANSAGSVRELSWFQKIYLFILSTGKVHFKIRSDFSVTCGLDMTYFPFDKQTCFADVAMQEFAIYQINMTKGDLDHVIMSEYQENGEWDLLTTSIENRQFVWENKPNPFSYVRFYFHLKRKPLFYILNILLPCVMLSVLQLSVFLVPPLAGEKVSLGITVLLSFTVFLLMVSDNMPQTSISVPVMGIYLICTLATSMLSLMVTILTLRLFHHDVRDPFPDWLRTVIRFMATVTCQGREKKLLDRNVSRRTVQEVKAEMVPEMVPEVAPEVKEKVGGKKFAETKHRVANGNIGKDEDSKWSGSSPWETSARIFDRFFAILFLLVILVVNVIMIGIIPLFA